MKQRLHDGCFFKLGVEKSIVNAPPDYNSHFLRVFIFNMQFHSSLFLRRVVDQLFKSNLTFCAVCVFNLQFEKSVVLRREAK
jgi:hypothetical protein